MVISGYGGGLKHELYNIMRSFRRNCLGLLIVLISVVATPSCQNLSDVWYAIDDIDERLTSVEENVEKMNTNIDALSKVCDALENNVSISRVIRLQDDSGYQITFSDGESIVIRDGRDGKDGVDGKDGEDGVDGKDGHTPVIAIDYDSVNGYYYWTIDGEPLLDPSGNKVRANGADAVVPRVAIGSSLGEEYDKDATYISVDGGKTWTKISGGSAASFFKSVTVDEASGKVTMVLADGTSIELPYVKDFMFAFAKSELSIPYGSDAQIGVTQSGVATYQIVKPDGWKASLKDDVLYVKSPSPANDFADTEGEIAVIAVSRSGFALIAKLNVGIQGGGIKVETTTGSRTVTLACAPDASLSSYRVYQKVFTQEEAASIDDDGILTALEDVPYLEFTKDDTVTLDVPDRMDAGSKAVVFLLLYDQKGGLAGVERVEFTVTVGRVELALSGDPTLSSATLTLTPNEWTEYYFLWVGKKSILESFKINEKDPASLIAFLSKVNETDKEAPLPVWLDTAGDRTFEDLTDDTDYTAVCVPVKGNESLEPVGDLTMLEFKTKSKSDIQPTVTAQIVPEASDWLYTTVMFKNSANSVNLYEMVVGKEEWDAYLEKNKGKDNRGYLVANAEKHPCDGVQELSLRFDTHLSSSIYILSMTENPAGVKSEISTIEHTTPAYVQGSATLAIQVLKDQIKSDNVMVNCNVSDDEVISYILCCETEEKWSEITQSGSESDNPGALYEYVCRNGKKFDKRVESEVQSFTGLKEDTRYNVWALAIDNEGKYGKITQSQPFTTAKKDSGSDSK